MNFGEIYICQFPFTSGVLSKPRPALVLFDLGEDVIICRITSVPHAGVRDVPILNWGSSGLLKPSIVRLDRLVSAEKKTLSTRLGVLSDADANNIRSIWNTSMRL
jgi:mRNA interferase MazF